MQRVFTTGQVARIFSVNINTVIKWFDEGKLTGFRLPRSNERRIYRDSVLAFMEKHGISTDLMNDFDEHLSSKKKGRKATRTGRGSRERNGEETRIFPRVPVTLDAVVRHSDESLDVLARVQVHNLSMGGAYLVGFSPEHKMIPEEFQLSVAANGNGPGLDGVCQVIHARRGDDSTYAVGVRFTRVDPGSLQTYLSADA